MLGERPPRRTLDGGTGALPAVACFSPRPLEPLEATVASTVTGVLQAVTGFSLPELRDPSEARAEPGGHGGHLHQPGGRGPTPAHRVWAGGPNLLGRQARSHVTVPRACMVDPG